VTSVSPLRRAAFLDRDGTLIVEREYLADPEGVLLVPGAVGALRRLRDAGYLLVVVTNQSGIGRGLYTEEDYRAVKARLDAVLEAEGVPLDGTWYCPDDPRLGDSPCRKPNTAMYRAAAHALGIDLAASAYVGDRLGDVLPALALGGRGILVRTGYGSEQREVPPWVSVVDDLAAAAGLLVEGAVS
jgi:D-glycero-D-manno-heptose 1,7-bisphosphate phosphatase